MEFLIINELREITHEIALLNQEVQLLRETLIELASDRKDEPQSEYDKYREKIRPHDPHKDWFEDEPQTERDDE